MKAGGIGESRKVKGKAEKRGNPILSIIEVNMIFWGGEIPLFAGKREVVKIGEVSRAACKKKMEKKKGSDKLLRETTVRRDFQQKRGDSKEKQKERKTRKFTL